LHEDDQNADPFCHLELKMTNTKVPLKQYWTLLIRFLTPQKSQVVLLVVVLFMHIGLKIVNPQIMRAFIDQTQAGGYQPTLLNLALVFLVFAVLQQVIAVQVAYTSEKVAWTATNALRSDLVKHCLNLDMSFHHAHTPGELIERIDGDVNTLSNFFSQFIIQVVGNSLLILGVLTFFFVENWRIGLAMGVFVFFALWLLVRLRDIAVPHWKAERKASADMYSFLEERLSGTEDIRANGLKEYMMRHFYRLMQEMLKSSLKVGLMINLLFNTTITLFALGVAAAFAVGAMLFFRDEISIGSVYLIFYYTAMMEYPIADISRQLGEVQRAGAGILRVMELLKLESCIKNTAEKQNGRLIPKGDALQLTFDGVIFGYSNGFSDRVAGTEKELVLNDLSFSLEPGQVLGLLGRTGSGKTTMTRLIFRLFDPDEGQVCLGNGVAIDIRKLPLGVLRERIGMVTQNVQLFHASVRDNLTFFDDDIPEERILSVIEELGLGGWLSSLPYGLDTILESGGGGLSGGEAQLLAFTRVFLKNPGLIILDEASSRLDLATEQLIERAVDRLVRQRTAIIIAHRLRTVLRADQIMILEDGKILEYGSREVLVKDTNSVFSSLLQTGLEEVLV
jgi:ABC-type multidrug transport system fused ATPase/permease subunit